MYPRIRDLREDKDMNQTTFAELVLDMSQTGYSKFETGENDIATEALIRMAIYHETSLDYLVGLTDEKTPYPASRNRQERMLKYREDIRKKLEKQP